VRASRTLGSVGAKAEWLSYPTNARKSDVLDCQWLQQLHTGMLVRYAAHHIQHMQKALEQMNLKLPHVVSDIAGRTGLAIIRALLVGERDPHVLARLRDRRCKADEATIARALQGTWRREHLFELRQAVEFFDFYHRQIAAGEAEIEAQLGQFEDKSGGQPLGEAGRGRTTGRGALPFDGRQYLQRLTSVDLTRIAMASTRPRACSWSRRSAWT
jgi:transposase